MNVKIKLFDGGRMPMFQREGDACADCYARFGSSGVNDDWYVFKSKDGFKITKELGGAYCHFSGTKEECQKWIENKEQGK